jgi:hypothetical protein
MFFLFGSGLSRLGFKNDSIEELFTDTLIITFNNKSFNSNNIPIIEGNAIVDAYLNFEYSVNQNLQYDELLWATRLEIKEINDETTVVFLISTGGPKGMMGLIMPLAPGVDPIPYPAGTSFSMLNGAPLYNGRLKAPGQFMIGPGYILDFYSVSHASFYISLGYYNYGIAHSTGSCSTGIISGNEVNEFLFGTKDIIDYYNPNGYNNFIIGYFYMYCFDDIQVQQWKSWHTIDMYIYEVIPIGDPL